MHKQMFDPVCRELEMVEGNLNRNINSGVDILNQASIHLAKAGGKRLRPAFALLAARFFLDNLEQVIPMATALELTHLATLVHDDVIDNSVLRRGTYTVKYQWGNRVSINAGNYIFARALALSASYQRRDILDVLAQASMRICEGEIYQMMSSYNVDVGLKNYLRRIERKTALLISVSCKLGAMIGGAQAAQIRALELYGYYLGMAFQVTDDILDFVADEEVLGKPTGSDIKQGVITLPAIYALKHSPDKEELRHLLSSPDLCSAQSERILDLVLSSDGVDYAYWVTEHYARKARKELDNLPDQPVKSTLYEIADFISAREY
ncbi:MAG: heptaprenyl diphosphate synthase [Syntrophomonadaceae bacterium]|jgi:heptaprenyl diphosphate synthase|nr:heptaprenyl diphosphate synthase [Syntrophomonadaceae bacterium]